MSYVAKASKSFLCIILAIMLSISGVIFSPAMEVSASATTQPATEYLKNVRAGVGMRYSGSVEITLRTKGQTIKKVKSNSKNLVAKQTYRYTSDSSHGSYYYNSDISFYAKKAGKYKISFDIVNANGKKVGKTRTITVRASGTGDVIKSAKIGKQNMLSNPDYNSYFTTKKSGKVKFTLAKGAKIKKITSSSYDAKGKMITKNFKNGKKANIGTYAYGYDRKDNYTYGDYYSNYSNWSRGFYGYTRFEITYTDSYSLNPKQERTTNFYVYRRATKWCKA